MIVMSIKGDGVEHLLGPVPTDLWGWQELQEILIPSGVDEVTGDQIYRESDRKVVGKTVYIELRNDGDKPETIAAMLWLVGPDRMSNIGTTPKEILPGESKAWSIVMEERRQAIWCLLRLTEGAA